MNYEQAGSRGWKKIVFITLSAIMLIFLCALGIKALQAANANKQESATASSVLAAEKGLSIKLQVPSKSLKLQADAKELALGVNIKVAGEATISKVDYLLDGQLAQTNEYPPYDATIDLTSLKESGTHTVQAIAFDTKGDSFKSDVFTFVFTKGEVRPATDDSEQIVGSTGGASLKNQSGDSNARAKRVNASISSFMANPASIVAGQSTTLSWSVTTGKYCKINHGIMLVNNIGSRSVSPTTTTTYTLTCSGLGGGKSASAKTTVTVTAVPDPVNASITSFSTSPSTIVSGQSTTLAWSVATGQNCTINQGINAVNNSGTQVISPTTTTVYALTCAGLNGGQGDSVSTSVTVTPAPTPVDAVIASFSASPASITNGQGSMLSWTVTTGLNCSINQGVGIVANSGSQSVAPNANTTYALTCNGLYGGQSATATTTITVTAAPVNASITSFAASPATIVSGTSTTLSWAVASGTGCSINQAVGAVANSGSTSVSPTTNTTYTLTCSGLNGGSSATTNATVTVTPVPSPVNASIASFAASPATITSGGSSTLTWAVASGTGCSINQSVGSVANNSSTSVSPTVDTAYTLSCSGLNGGSSATASASVTVTPVQPAGELGFARVPWEGGSSYYTQATPDSRFAKANAAGWGNPNFFPVGVYLSKGETEHANTLKAAGINTYVGMEHYAPNLALATNAGMYVIAQQREWTPAEVGTNPNVVGWFASDECEMGYDNCDPSGTGTAESMLAVQQGYVNNVRALQDGRFVMANFGNGVLRTFWGMNGTMAQHVQLMDASGADKYMYTSPHVQGIVDGVHDAPDWPNGTPVGRAYAYGWMIDQMKRFQDPAKPQPTWGVVESAKPYLTEPGSREILPDEMEGAVWSSLIHEARGIMYFQHNNGTVNCTQNYSIVDCPTVRAKVTAVNAKVQSLAPVLNTQSYYNDTRVVNGHTYYQYSFGNNTDTMLKTYNNNAYIFAGLGMGHTTGSKTFSLPTGVTGTSVEVVGESRTITVTAGQFTDSFANEYSHHVYKIAL